MTRTGWLRVTMAALMASWQVLAVGQAVNQVDGRPAPPGPWQHPPELPMSRSLIVRVRSEAQLYQALSNLRSNTTILLEPGTYRIDRLLLVGGGVKNVCIRGNSNDRSRVVLRGPGMRNKQNGAEVGIMISDATDVTIANLSIGEFWFHPIQLQGQLGCKRVRIYNVRVFNAGEQFIKAAHGVDDCRVEYCVFEFTDTSRHSYTQAVDVLGSSGWQVRNNLFRNIRGPKNDSSVGGCIDFWNGSRNTLVEGNIIINCRMGIRFGIVHLSKQKGIHDHEGGTIRNNVIWRQPGAVIAPDGGIMVWDSPGTKILQNTVVFNDTFFAAIEYRWCKDVVIANNLTDAKIWQREQAQAEQNNNKMVPESRAFVSAANADLHVVGKTQSIAPVSRLADCLLDLDGRKRSERTAPGAFDFPIDTPR